MECWQNGWDYCTGARDAPMIWQECFRCQMKLLGFKESLRLPRMLYRETKGVADDCTR